jgi:hypothetical protein
MERQATITDLEAAEIRRVMWQLHVVIGSIQPHLLRCKATRKGDELRSATKLLSSITSPQQETPTIVKELVEI